MEFRSAEDTGCLKHLNRGREDIIINDLRHTGLAIQTTLCRLGFPFLRIAVSIETYGFAGHDIFLDDIEEHTLLGFAFLDTCIHFVFEEHELLGYSRIERQHRGTAVRRRTDSTELEAVAGKGKGRSTVAIGVIQQNLGYICHAEFHFFLGVDDNGLFGLGMLELVEHSADLFSEENRDDSGRCLVRTQTVFVGCTDDRGFEQSVMTLHGHEDVDEESDKLQVLVRILTRCKQVNTRIGGHRPVAMLTTSVHTRIGFLMQQHAEMMFLRHTLHDRHDEQVMVIGQIDILKDRRHLELVRRHLVMTRLNGYTGLEGFVFEFAHEGQYTCRDSPEIMVLELLRLSAVMAHECSSGK